MPDRSRASIHRFRVFHFFPNHHPNFQPKKFHMKNREITYEIWDTSRVFCTSNITSPDPTPNYQNSPVFNLWYHMRPIYFKIKYNLIQTYRLGVDFKHFLKFIWNPNPNRSAIDPPEFDPTANYHHLQLSIPWNPRLYTAIHIQTTENKPGTLSWPLYRVSIHKKFLGFLNIRHHEPRST
jgi:hypothetical protein